MPVFKSPLLRYRILNSCFSSGPKRYWTIPELITRLQQHDLTVDKRTLERDFEMMRHDTGLGYHAPIAYDKTRKAFHYTDPHFTIDAVPLTTEDLQALTLAANILHQYKNAKWVQQFEGTVDKLNKVVSHLKQPQNNKLIAFENTPYYKGHDFFDGVLQAVTDEQPLRILYRKFSGNQNDEHLFHPYFLKEYRGRWYVLGYSEARAHVITLALDRFIKMEDAPVLFRQNKTWKPKEYFQHTLGITLGNGPAEEIELWFSGTMAPYIKTQHLHHTQKIVHEDADGLTIILKLIPNPELTQLILSYGADIKVIRPAALKQHIQHIHQKAAANA